MTQHAQIAERKYCRPHARPFRLDAHQRICGNTSGRYDVCSFSWPLWRLLIFVAGFSFGARSLQRRADGQNRIISGRLFGQTSDSSIGFWLRRVLALIAGNFVLHFLPVGVIFRGARPRRHILRRTAERCRYVVRHMAGARCESGRDNHQCNQTSHLASRGSIRRALGFMGAGPLARSVCPVASNPVGDLLRSMVSSPCVGTGMTHRSPSTSKISAPSTHL
jgi:hypothetical protein